MGMGEVGRGVEVGIGRGIGVIGGEACRIISMRIRRTIFRAIFRRLRGSRRMIDCRQCRRADIAAAARDQSTALYPPAQTRTGKQTSLALVRSTVLSRLPAHRALATATGLHPTIPACDIREATIRRLVKRNTTTTSKASSLRLKSEGAALLPMPSRQMHHRYNSINTAVLQQLNHPNPLNPRRHSQNQAA